MPFDPFGGRPGFRYIPDPMGRLGFGHYVPERELPDPFGRLPAPEKPDPEIADFQNPFAIRDSVGMSGHNNRRDVAKIESLLGRAGALDLAETDGVTGFFGARTDEAVRKFQKDHGLEADGLINPEGPTLKALASLTQPIERRQPVPPGTIEEFPRPDPEPDPRRDTVRRIVERLLSMQRQGDDPLDVDRPGRRLAQAESEGATTNDRDASNNAPDSGGNKPTDANAPVMPPAKAGDGEPKPSPGSAIEVPAYRREVLAAQPGVWEEFNREAGKLPDITETEKTVLAHIFAAEGGGNDDPDSSAASGILQETLDRAKKGGQVPGIENVETPSDLTVAQRAAVMRDYFDDTLKTVGGGKALDTIGDTQATGAFADTIYRHGRSDGTKIIQEAVNKVRENNGEAPIAKDGKMGPATVSAFRQLAVDPETRLSLSNKLNEFRKTRSPSSEHPRIDFFSFGSGN